MVSDQQELALKVPEPHARRHMRLCLLLARPPLPWGRRDRSRAL